MPVIKHFAGNCHVYVDRAADPEMAERLTVNAKCQRMGVCNAAESLVIHEAVAPGYLPKIATELKQQPAERRIADRTGIAAARGRVCGTPSIARRFTTRVPGW